MNCENYPAWNAAKNYRFAVKEELHKSAATLTSLVKVTSPPISSTAFLTIASPIPVPGVFLTLLPR